MDITKAHSNITASGSVGSACFFTETLVLLIFSIFVRGMCKKNGYFIVLISETGHLFMFVAICIPHFNCLFLSFTLTSTVLSLFFSCI